MSRSALTTVFSKNGRYLESSSIERHGFSSCEICKARLMYYLERGHNFDDVMRALAERHPQIRDIRTYSRRAVRETTGWGMYDDYIVSRWLWPVRNPCMAPAGLRPALKHMWAEYADRGRRISEAIDVMNLAAAGGKDDEIVVKKETILTIMSLFREVGT